MLDIQSATVEIREEKQEEEKKERNNRKKLDGCIVRNAHNTVLGEEALLIHIVPVSYAT